MSRTSRQRLNRKSFLTIAAGGILTALLAPLRAQVPPSGRNARSATLQDELEKGLRARRPEEFAFLRRVVKLVEDGQLSLELVRGTFDWARRRRPIVPYPYFERALKLAPSNPSVLSNLALANAANGDLNSAESLLRTAIASPMAKPRVRKNLALILKLKGRESDANKILAEQQPPLRSGTHQPSSQPAAAKPSEVAQASQFRR